MVAATQQQVSPQQQNANARALILSQSVERIQQVFSSTQNSLSSGNNVINVVPRNVGLIKGFFVDVAVNLTVTSADRVAITPLGASNLLSQAILNDLNNNTRVQTTGWHLHAVNTARLGRPYGMPFAMDRSPTVAPSLSPVAITIDASPFTFANPTDGPISVYVVGGTVSNISLSNGTDTINTGQIDGTFQVPAGWSLITTYSVVPTSMKYTAIQATPNEPVSYGANWLIQVAPKTIYPNEATTLVFRYYVPAAYSRTDLRGAIYANVVNATMQLQLSLNANMIVAQGADPTSAVYQAETATAPEFTVNSAEITVYQHYLDQLPMGQQGPILPALDISTIYELKNTTLTGLSQGQDFPVPYSNFRSYLSTTIIYDNGGELNNGSDINYISIQSANYTNLLKMTPDEYALLAYLMLGTGLPGGMYYLSHRDNPISTIQYGNMDFIINPSDVQSGAQLLVGYEDMALTNLLNNAGSLPGG